MSMQRAILGVLGALLLTAGAFGADNAIPLDHRIPWQTDYRAAAEQAAKERKLVLLHFESDDCAPCRRLEANVFSRPEVAAAVAASYVPVKINVARAPEMARRYSVASWPQDVIVTPMGQEVERRVSPQRPEDYIAALKSAASRAAPLTARNTMPAAKPSTMQPAGYQQPAPKGKTPSPDLSSGFESPLIENGAPTSPEPKAAPQSGEYTAQPQTNPYLPQPSSDRTAARAPAANDSDYVAAGPSGGQENGTDYQPVVKPSNEPPAPSTDLVRPPADLVAKSPSDKPAEATPHKAPILPPIGMEGYCVVTLHEYNKKVAELADAGQRPDPTLQGWVKGSKKFGAVHRGRLYLFANATAQKSFLADPDRYAPALSGYDAVAFRETGKLVEGKRAFGLSTSNGQIYLFANKTSLEKFEATPNPYAETVYQAMLRSDEASKRR
jgi:YHS domain-containing protein